MKKEKLLCPLRLLDVGSSNVFKLPKTDHWHKRGPDLVCSYCGSMHPEQFLKLLPTIKEDSDDIWIELSDRQNKVYITRKDIHNAGDGAIKVYLAHISQWGHDQGMGKEEMDELIRQINAAILKSSNIFNNIIKPKFESKLK